MGYSKSYLQADELSLLRFAEELFQKRVEDAVTGVAIAFNNKDRDWQKVVGVCNRWRKLIETGFGKKPGGVWTFGDADVEAGAPYNIFYYYLHNTQSLTS